MSTHASDSGDAAFLRLYGELRHIAERMLRREGAAHTLQPTALLHEAWFKLAGSPSLATATREQYLGTAAKAMRQVLVDYARRRRASKRGGDMPVVTLGSDVHAVSIPLEDLLTLDDALARLAQYDERLARVVEMRFFAGLEEEEVARTLGVTTRTVQRDWVKARAWLHSELEDRAVADP
jgi:RNA polymerase sigma factor (TIGR02999 family)